jgi:hypothetical protein
MLSSERITRDSDNGPYTGIGEIRNDKRPVLRRSGGANFFPRRRMLADFPFAIRAGGHSHHSDFSLMCPVMQGPYWPVSTTTAACSERRCSLRAVCCRRPGT